MILFMYKKESIAKLILLGLEKTVDGFVRADDFINNPKLYAFGSERELKKSALAQALKRLREKGFVDKIQNKDTGKIIYKLTELGREFVLLNKPEDEIEWDGKWRIVVFDIPETKKLIREVLRGRLKVWGFKKWQKSVWASKKNITDKLRHLIKDLGIEDWVLVIESENVGK